ncbi:hypothetical protein CTKA_02080 [Chthonomonas calidirosea]|uniref:Uncharacterized protein n=1 Tax=Chthonomonas calidirosea (strain DSM 23976 / ICMP 18418 / T49) TaxID=1303518 RepID=S0EYY9_CHTCT|nr:hypothetical protein CCALI_02015 [Chthonomonas calidirosea T49]CEK19143.1 hypothetical protein CTKA_02080 [Chthonomonas calidirosea]
MQRLQAFKAGRLPALQEEGPARQLPLPRSETDQTRPGQQPPLSAQAGLAALPQPSGSARYREEPHREPLLRQVVHVDPDRLCAAGPLEAARGGLAHSAAGHEPQGRVQQQREEGESQGLKDSFPHRQWAPRLAAEALDRDPQKPRDGVY